MSPKPVISCEICGERTTIFPFYRAEKDFLEAWKENAFFEAWVFSLLQRKHVSCQPNMTLFIKGIDIGEIDLLVDKKFIIEITTGGSVIGLAHELFGKNILLGRGYQLMLLHSESIDNRIKKMLKSKGIITIDNAASDLKSNERFLNHFK